MEQTLEEISIRNKVSHARVNFLWGIATGVPKSKAEELFESYMDWYDNLGDRTIKDKIKHHNLGLKYFEYRNREENK